MASEFHKTQTAANIVLLGQDYSKYEGSQMVLSGIGHHLQIQSIGLTCLIEC